jgi:hypothetical protein
MRQAASKGRFPVTRIVAVALLLATAFWGYPSGAQNAQAPYVAPSGSGPIGVAVGGLALSLKGPRSPIRLGDPVWVTVELRNTSHQTQRLFLYARPSYVQNWPAANYSFTIVDRANAAVVPSQSNGENAMGAIAPRVSVHQLDPGTSMYTRIRVDQFYDFAMPGTYAAIVNSAVRYIYPTDSTTIAPQSNPITLNILAGRTIHPAPISEHTLGIQLQTDRPAYVMGEPIFTRLIVSNLTREPVPIGEGWAGNVCSLILLDGLDNPVSPTLGGAQSFESSMGRPELPSRKTMVLGYLGEWVTLERWGLFYYKPLKPDNYTLVALSTISADSSKPLHVKVLTKTSAESEPRVALRSPDSNHTVNALIDQYSALRTELMGMINKVPRTEYAASLFFQFGSTWSPKLDGFEERLNRVPSAGDANSPYVQLIANLLQSKRYLALAEAAAIAPGPESPGPTPTRLLPANIQAVAGILPGTPPAKVSGTITTCDVAKAVGEVRVADYFVDAVKKDLAERSAGVGDAAYPPEVVSAPKKCRW